MYSIVVWVVLGYNHKDYVMLTTIEIVDDSWVFIKQIIEVFKLK